MKKINISLIQIIVIVVIIALAGVAYYFYSQYNHTQAILNNPTIATKEEIKTLTSKIGKMIELPNDEEPTIATVLDKSKLKDQPFFKKAENGDKVIIYVKSLKAILYRPSTSKVIDFSVVTMAPQSLRVALYNGTNKVGLTEKLQKEFEANITGLTVTTKENAKNKDYDKTLIIDLSGNRPNEVKQLANLLNGEVSKLPSGEQKPETVNNQTAEILIIIGDNYNGLVNLPAASPSPHQLKSN